MLFCSECPLNFMTFEANDNDNREMDDFEDECTKTVVTSEVLIRFTSVDKTDLQTDQVSYYLKQNL